MNIILFEQIDSEGIVPKSDFRYEHIIKVLHLQEGDTFSMGRVNGPSGLATILAVDNEGLRYSWEVTNDCVPLYPVTLMVAQVRPICMKRILREAVSLGVHSIVVTGTDTGEKSYRDAKLWSTGEYRKYLLDGAMQSSFTGIPELTCFDTIDEALESHSDTDNKIVLDNVEGSDPLSSFEYREGSVLLAVGPERGWSERERMLFTEHAFEFRLLGKRTLRTETACSAGLAVLLSRMRLL